LRKISALSARRADRVFFVSEWSRHLITRKLRLPFEKSCVIYHGVSECFRPREEKFDTRGKESSPYVLVVGSISPYKDYITLLKAWKVVVKSIDHCVKLLIVGPISDSQYYEELVPMLLTLQIRESVSFVTRIHPSEMPALYQKASVLVMPSYVETFGLPMLEAMACGIPVIASDIPVAREVCGEAAYYYRLGDPDDLAEKLLSVLRDSSKRFRLIEAGMERAQHFSWDKVAIELLQLLKSVL
jgi:glycosyltransferase involved in cell wall biosynthesis